MAEKIPAPMCAGCRGPLKPANNGRWMHVYHLDWKNRPHNPVPEEKTDA